MKSLVIVCASLLFLNGCKNSDTYSSPLDNPALNIEEFKPTRVAKTAQEAKEILSAFGRYSGQKCKYYDYSHLKAGEKFIYSFEMREPGKKLSYTYKSDIVAVNGPASMETTHYTYDIRTENNQGLSFSPMQWTQKITNNPTSEKPAEVKVFDNFVLSFSSTKYQQDFCSSGTGSSKSEVSEGYYTLSNGIKVRAMMEKVRVSQSSDCADKGPFTSHSMNVKVWVSEIKTLSQCNYDVVANLEYQYNSQGAEHFYKFKTLEAPLLK